VDDAVQQGKESIEALCKQAKLKIDGFEAKAAQIYSNAIASSEETAKKIGEWTADKTKGAQKFAAVNTLLAGAMLAKAAGVEAGVAIDILAAAGFK
jgi:hypothetical protein